MLLCTLAFASRMRFLGLAGWIALGVLNAAVFWVQPIRDAPRLDLSRPVIAGIEASGHWLAREQGWALRAKVLYLRQGEVVDTAPRTVWVEVPGPHSPTGATYWRAKGHLRASTPLSNFVGRGVSRSPVVDSLSLRLKSRRLLEPLGTKGPESYLAGWLFRARSAIDDAFPAHSARPQLEANLAGALLLGDAGRLPGELRSTLRAFGLAHLMAVSGLHLGLVAWLILIGARLLPGHFRPCLVVCGAVAFALLVGWRPSLLRALVMLVLVLASVAVARPGHSKNSLALACAGLVAFDPRLAHDLGFQLTFVATAGILWLSPRLRILRRLPFWLSGPLSMSFGAQLATLPLTVGAFSVLSPAAILLNLLFVPLTAMLLSVSLVSTFFVVAGGSVPGVVWLALKALSAPFTFLSGLKPNLFLTVPLACPAIVLLLIVLVPVFSGRWVRVALLTVAMVLSIGRDHFRRQSTEGFQILDVGQGDAILLRSRNRAILVDGGGWRVGDLAAKVLVPVLAAHRIRKIDLMVMTHADLDHCGGLLDLTRYVPIKELWVPPEWSHQECGRKLVTRLAGRVRVVGVGKERKLGEWRLEVEWPPLPGESKPARSINDGSIVLRCRYRSRTLILTGDISDRVEEVLMKRDRGFRADWLKLAHHGSRSSSSEGWLRQVDPALALVSSSRRNPFGHPAPEVLDRLTVSGIALRRTDRDGAIRIRLDHYPLTFVQTAR